MSKVISPINTLKEVVQKHESALKHSMISFNKGEINIGMHKMHRRNNRRIIKLFNNAIKILEEHGKEKFL